MYFSRYDDPFMRPRRVPVRRAVNGRHRQIDPNFQSDNFVGNGDPLNDFSPLVEDAVKVADYLNDTPMSANEPTKIKVNGTAKTTQPEAQPMTDEPDWKAKAIRLQAEMDNFRKRQTRRADDAIAAERERLLAMFLPAVDNLSRALAHENSVHKNGNSLRQGIELTHRELTRLLEAEGVMPIETINQEFDPAWHEAISVIPAEAESGTIIEEVEAGYKSGEKLLRPAKVVVAV